MELVYQALLQELDGLLAPGAGWVSNLANTSALLFQRISGLNWAGFYVVHQNRLVLGPFQGKPACLTIEKGRGVCGSAWEKKEVLCVPDVHQFEGHIACDGDSVSEIVLPLYSDGTVAAVMDLDSPTKNRFSRKDEEGLRKVAGLLEKRIRWEEREALGCLPEYKKEQTRSE